MVFDRATMHPSLMGDLACIRNNRVTVSAVLGQLVAGNGIEQVLADSLEREDILAAHE